MELKEIGKSELAELYHHEMIYDFPRGELKPLPAMYRQIKDGIYDTYLAVDRETTVGYALALRTSDPESVLLDYLGVPREMRNHGMGGQILDLLTRRYRVIFAEVEAPVSEDQEENSVRKSRISFYMHNGFRILNYECGLFGVHYNVLCFGDVEDQSVMELHRAVYSTYRTPPMFKKYIQIPLHPGEKVNPAPGRHNRESDRKDLSS